MKSSVLFASFFKRTHVSRLRFFSVFQLVDRGHIEIVGTDSKKFLQGLCTNDVVGRLHKRGDAIATLFLTSKGRILSDSIIYDNTNEELPRLIVEIHEKYVKSLVSFLNQYKLRSKVGIKQIAVQSFFSDRNLVESSAELPGVPDIISTDPIIGGSGCRFLYIDSVGDTIGSERRTQTLDWQRFRYLRGIPEGTEIEGKIPLEMNMDLLDYISFKKGCYIGQELIARTKHKGLVRKRLVPFLVPSYYPAVVKVQLEHLESLRLLSAGKVGCVSFSTLKSGLMESAQIEHAGGANPASNIQVGDAIYLEYHRQLLAANFSEDKIGIAAAAGPGRSDDEGDKSAGEVVCFHSQIGMGFALVRLEALFSENARKGLTSFCVKTNSVRRLPDPVTGLDYQIDCMNTQSSETPQKCIIFPFRPHWWPDRDPVTGKEIYAATSN